ncbi:MAG: hypothetical protein ABIH89_03125 [Elusimicrobiota bacterium]
MYELIKEKLSLLLSREEKVYGMLEFINLMILKIMFDRGMLSSFVLSRGAVLSTIYGLRDRPASIEFYRTEKSRYTPDETAEIIAYELCNYGLKAEVSSVKRDDGSEHLQFCFKELARRLGLANNGSADTKFEIIMRNSYSAGWESVITHVSSSFGFTLRHLDRDSLFAARLSEFFTCLRSEKGFIKELLWFHSNGIEPNYLFLKNSFLSAGRGNGRAGIDDLISFFGDGPVSRKLKTMVRQTKIPEAVLRN